MTDKVGSCNFRQCNVEAAYPSVKQKDITVAVTGASGYVAGQVIKCLLDNGYTVRGTVRSVSNKEKVAHLERTFPGLQLFEADLLKEGSFNECFKGLFCHTFSSFVCSELSLRLCVRDAHCFAFSASGQRRTKRSCW